MTNLTIAKILEPVDVPISQDNKEKYIKFSHRDFVNPLAWLRFRDNVPMTCYDFADVNQWWRYFYISIGLTEGCVIVEGEEGSGKSTWMYKVARDMRELFGKGVTFLKDLPVLDGFGEADSIGAAGFMEEWAKLTVLSKDKNYQRDSIEELQKYSKLYNRVICDDEAHEDMRRRGMNKYGMYLADFIKQRRHYHNLMIFCTPNAKKDLGKSEVLDRITHHVECKFGELEPGKSFYKIFWKRYRITKTMQLTPSEYGNIFDSWNIIGMPENIDNKRARQLERGFGKGNANTGLI